jgi:hypothetical protein
VLKSIERDLSKEGLNALPINQHKTYSEILCEMIESLSITKIGMSDLDGQFRLKFP